MGWRDDAKKFGKKVEGLGRDIRDSPVGHKITEVAEDIGKSVRDWFKSDKVQNSLKEIEHKFRDVRDDLIKSLKPLPKDKQEEALKTFDEYKLNSDESLHQARNEEDFDSKSKSVFSDLLKITSNLRGAGVSAHEGDNSNVDFSGANVVNDHDMI